MRFKKHIRVNQTPGTSFEKDMAERDETASIMNHVLALGGGAIVRLHANLDDEEIRRAIRRYKDIQVVYCLVESDSTPDQRRNFLERWKAAGGPDISLLA